MLQQFDACSRADQECSSFYSAKCVINCCRHVLQGRKSVAPSGLPHDAVALMSLLCSVARHPLFLSLLAHMQLEAALWEVLSSRCALMLHMCSVAPRPLFLSFVARLQLEAALWQVLSLRCALKLHMGSVAPRPLFHVTHVLCCTSSPSFVAHLQLEAVLWQMLSSRHARAAALLMSY
jgi:hypothetical protein